MNYSYLTEGDRTRQKIFDAIAKYINDHGYSPTVREICEMTGIRSTSTVTHHIHKLMDLGRLESDHVDANGNNKPRALRIPGHKLVKVDEA